MNKKDILEKLYSIVDTAYDKAVETTADLDDSSDRLRYIVEFSELRSFFRNELIDENGYGRIDQTKLRYISPEVGYVDQDEEYL